MKLELKPEWVRFIEGLGEEDKTLVKSMIEEAFFDGFQFGIDEGRKEIEETLK